MEEPIKVLFITQEITPFLPESEIATICRYLPQAVQDRGNEIRAFMPKFVSINERRNQLHEVQRLSGMNIIIDDTDHPLIIKVASLPAARIQVYFIDNEDYFHRRNIVKDANGVDYKDNGERAIFFARGVLETIKKLRWTPDVIHCHGWMTSLVPLYIKKAYADDPFFKNAKVVYSLYQDHFDQPLQNNFADILLFNDMKETDVNHILKTPVDFQCLQQLAISYADGIIQGSEHVDESLIQYTTQEKKHVFLPYQPTDDYTDAYINFYRSLL
jgi:starch synthase